MYLRDDEFMIPGFVDTHTHAAQYGNVGVGLQYELLEWLEKVTFPTEASFRPGESETGHDFIQRITKHYTDMVEEYLAAGTTTCCYFGSIQVPANVILAKVLMKAGQRAFVGKVCMDCNSPDFYCERTGDSLDDTIQFCKVVEEIDSGHGLVKPILTPRFAITCSRELMKGLAEVARTKNLNIQTHLSENKGEISFVGELFSECKDYTTVYKDMGLLTEKTVLAHAIYLSEDEQQCIIETRSSLSHCPNSNFALSSGIMPLKNYLSKGIKVGLGTDVSGGYSLSILDAIRQAIIGSKALSFQGVSPELTIEEAFYLATLGGAQALAVDGITGNFQPSKYFDALRVKLRKPTGRGLRADFERFLFTGDDRDILETIVQGRVVCSKVQ